ncbi:MAG: DUF3568 family protein [Tepidisphaeraceae bacterium]|jgi:hypothetical protein
MKRPLRFSNLLIAGITIALPLFCGGCALIPLATLGTIFGIAGTAASTGPEIYQQGKLDTALMADFVSVQIAVRLSAEDLGLHKVRDRKASKHEAIWDFQLQDDLQSKIEITVESRAANLCRCRIDVGLFGSEPTAKLILSQIQSHLSPATRP